MIGQSFSTKAQVGEALDFSGASNYVTLPNLLPSGSYTKEAWVNARSFSPFNVNIVSGSISAFWAPNGNLSSGHNFAYVTIQDATPMNTSQWYHVAVTYDAGTNTMILYKNGTQVATGNPVGVYTGETNAYIGAYDNGGGPSFLWDGQIDEVRIWNVVRTPAEITAGQSCILTGDEPGLLAYYNFDQGVAGGNNVGVTTLNDISDKCAPNNGTLTGFALTGATSNWVAPGAGISGSCGGTFANINLAGNALCISDGDVTPSLTDFTDFGSGLTRTFTIQNTGSAVLNIGSITFSGPNASEFSVTSSPSATVAAAGSTTFTITFTPASNGSKLATVNINNDDADELIYNFNIAAIFSTLPVNFKSFTITKLINKSQLNWVTASENNNLGFEILRSVDGINWTKIGFVAGSGTISTDKSYIFTDASPAKGINYYQLKQIDIDNRSKYSAIRTVTFASDYNLVYPVPTSDKVIIELKDSKLIGSAALISDQNGKLVQRVTITNMQQEISLYKLPTGMYFLKMTDGSSYKLIKQ